MFTTPPPDAPARLSLCVLVSLAPLGSRSPHHVAQPKQMVKIPETAGFVVFRCSQGGFSREVLQDKTPSSLLPFLLSLSPFRPESLREVFVARVGIVEGSN